MTVSTKPYLVRAIYTWCLDNFFTPYVVVKVIKGTRVPSRHVQQGEIVLSIHPDATHQLLIDNHTLSFSARFSGVKEDIVIPLDALKGIFAKENGQGLFFEVEETSFNDEYKPKNAKTTLRVVK